MPIKTIFLDRDGVINHEVNYLHKISDLKFIDGIFEACISFKKLGYQIIIISNQSGISRGYYSDEDYHKLTKWLVNKSKQNNVNLLDTFYCPHSPKDQCNCRKPKPGMFLTAKYKHNIDMQNSWMIGDREDDIIAANNSGITNTILVKSGHKIDELNSNAKYILNSLKNAKKIITF